MAALTAARSAHQLAGPRVPRVKPTKVGPTIQDFTAAADRLDAISDRVRLQILWWLTLDERSVTELCGLVGKRQQAVTHHLNILKLRRIVAFRRQGPWNVYYLTQAGRELMAAARLIM
jgi:DNA-binding transcriptional ArsR family regulator